MAVTSTGSRVTVVGAGALGCALAPHLAAMDRGELRIIDGDFVEAHNLERQPIYSVQDVGRVKVEAMSAHLMATAPHMSVIATNAFLSAGNATDLLAGSSIVADCTDDLHAKALIDKACAGLGIPLVSGSVHEAEGQVITLHAPGHNEHLQRNDLFEGRPGPEQDGCDMQRVPPEVIAAVGLRMAEVINDLLNGRTVVNGKIELVHHGTWTAYSLH